MLHCTSDAATHETPDLDQIADDLRTLARLVERAEIVVEGDLDLSEVLGCLADAVGTWHEAVEG